MIGVVGPPERAEELADALGGECVVGAAEAVVAEAPDVVAAIGEAAASALLAAGVDAPVLPVDAGPGLESTAAERAPAVLEAGLASGFETRERPVLEAAVDGEPCGRGLFDAMLVTTEPARISEFAVETAAWNERFRADGVVVTTPAGSVGYSRAVGGPVLDPGSGGLAVVPVAAFTTRPTVRVVTDDTPLEARVERDEGDVSLLVDGDERRGVPPRRPVSVRVAGSLATAVDPDG